MEILNSFGRAGRQTGLRIDEITAKAEESAAGIVGTLRKDYLDSAKREFARLHRSAETADGDSAEQLSNGTVLRVRDIRWLFPTELSPTLADLVDEIIGFRIDIVVIPGRGC
jgi:hypothetical protein